MKRTDWQAVERDFRTASFTLRELAEKYGISHQAIAKQAKKNEWSQDLMRWFLNLWRMYGTNKQV